MQGGKQQVFIKEEEAQKQFTQWGERKIKEEKEEIQVRKT